MKLGGANASEEAPCRDNTWQNSKLVISISWKKIWYCAATWYTMSGHPNLSYPMASAGAVETELHKVPETKAMATFQETKSQNPYLHPLAFFKLGHVAWSWSNSKFMLSLSSPNFST